MSQFSITTTNGYTVTIDAADYESVAAFGWFRTVDGYVRHSKGGESLARFIMQPPRHMRVTHANGNKLDHRRANLRVVTPAVAQRQKRKRPGTASMYIGVCRTPRRDKWRAYIGYPQVRIGAFECEHDAARARDAAALAMWGDDALLNFP